MAAANAFPRDWGFMEIDPIEEIENNSVIRNSSRKLPEFLLSQVTFFQSILFMVECFLPLCKGHRKFGIATGLNVPVIFRHHDAGKEPVYVTFRNQACKPLRVPIDGDLLLSGVKWKLNEASDPSRVVPSIFDCLVAALRDRMLMKQFCLECLLMHSNGTGLLFERFLKTVLYHVVPYFKSKDKALYSPYKAPGRASDMKLKRISWGTNGRWLKHGCLETHQGFKEIAAFFVDYYNNPVQQAGSLIEPNSGILRHLNKISEIDVFTRCGCEGGRTRHKKCFIGLLRKAKRSNALYSITLAQWVVEGDEYEDPLWNWSLLGSDNPTPLLSRMIVKPLRNDCLTCKHHIDVIDIQTPETTWLFMADLAEPLQKMNFEGLRHIRNYSIGGATFYLAFILMYCKENGHFSSMNFYHEGSDGVWRLFDDARGGLLKDSDPKRVRYPDRVNLRAFYFRVTESNPHRCLQKAASRFSTFGIHP